MRLRIVHQLSLLLAGAVLLSVAAVGGLVAWNLKTGFSDYLRSRDEQQLERFAQVVAERANLGHVNEPGSLRMRDLMDEFLHREGLAPPPDRPAFGQDRPFPPPQGGGYAAAPPPRRDRPPPRRADLPPPRRSGVDEVVQRLQVVDLQGLRLGGPDFPADRTPLEQPVLVSGIAVARVRMLPSGELQGVDARFLNRQYSGLALALAATLTLALAAAWFAAGWLGSPLRNVRAATRRIAAGELGVVVPESGSQEMAELIGDVNRMAASLKSLEGARRRWLAQISHELRTPLSVLLGELESIQDGAREATPALIAGLRGEVLHLARLVDDMHTLSMADLGALACVFSDGDAGAMFAQIAGRFQSRASRAGLGLVAAGESGMFARWDFGRIDQLVTNLLENSLRYTAAPGEVRMQWQRQGAAIELRIDDTPPGVAPGQLEAMFEPLYRADSARQRNTQPGQGGSGLGLAICRAIVHAHGGKIHTRPSTLGGIGIVVSLPLDPDRA